MRKIYNNDYSDFKLVEYSKSEKKLFVEYMLDWDWYNWDRETLEANLDTFLKEWDDIELASEAREAYNEFLLSGKKLTMDDIWNPEFKLTIKN